MPLQVSLSLGHVESVGAPLRDDVLQWSADVGGEAATSEQLEAAQLLSGAKHRFVLPVPEGSSAASARLRICLQRRSGGKTEVAVKRVRLPTTQVGKPVWSKLQFEWAESGRAVAARLKLALQHGPGRAATASPPAAGPPLGTLPAASPPPAGRPAASPSPPGAAGASEVDAATAEALRREVGLTASRCMLVRPERHLGASCEEIMEELQEPSELFDAARGDHCTSLHLQRRLAEMLAAKQVMEEELQQLHKDEARLTREVVAMQMIYDGGRDSLRLLECEVDYLAQRLVKVRQRTARSANVVSSDDGSGVASTDDGTAEREEGRARSACECIVS
eukprot:TRINITY_DN9697_c0_g2_i2.p1 TRINITY_DN9697_c0_g2~~TRINITY_DN9697_c0_g2_i2.p1  ORF type:complete len:351 (+),score=112.76 TRINITY_DN9697_c0_g2_i2:51-1055(+)